MLQRLSFLLFAIALASCYRNAQGPSFDESVIVPPDTMVLIMTDLHIMEGIASISDKKDTATATLNEKTLNIILNKYHLDRNGLEENIRYYTYHTEEYDKIYDKVIINLSKLESETKAESASKPEEEDQ